MSAPKPDNAWYFDPLTPLKYGALMIDPPWSYQMRTEDGYDKSPEAHYATMTEAEISALPVRLLCAPDCLVWLWTTYPHMDQAIRVLKRWGFTYKTGGPWVKITKNGKLCFGTGFVFRNCAEAFIIGTMGSPKIGSKTIRNAILARRREHSRKPNEAREALRALRPDCHIAELFSREPWEGCDVWGWEKDKFGGQL